MNKSTPKIYRTTNWSSYNRALINRGNIAIWFDPNTEIKYLKVAKLLLSSDMEIQDIALYLGYIQPANFARAFKKWSGVAPIQFRKHIN